MTFLKTLTRHMSAVAWLAESLALLGAALYAVQSFIYSHQIIPTLDEGSYLYKGYLFATGVYRPFQDYGPLTNKMPLSFLIPGWIQAIFGPGLRTGRYFAIVMGVLMLLGLWLAARRLSGKWWAAAVVWAIAINPILIKFYSQALSEGLTAFILAWVLALTLGEKLKLWQTTLGGVMLGLLVATRQNMLVMVPFILVYFFWQHGRKAGLWAAAACALPLVVVHALYWPNIMQVWLPWIPRGLLPFLDDLRAPVSGAVIWNPVSDALGIISAFWIGIRHQFIPMVGALCTWILWPRKENWKNAAQFRAAIMLSVTLVILTAAHGAAAFGKDYCLYCFTIYLSFFCEIGFLLVAVSFSAWDAKPGIIRQALALVVTLVCATGVIFAGREDLDPILLNIQVPPIRGLQLQPGSWAPLWGLLVNKYHVTYGYLQLMVPFITGLLGGVLILLVVLVVFLVGRKKARIFSPGYLSLVALFLIGVGLTPTVVLGNGDRDPACGDILAAYETVGAHLAKLVPPGSLVDWNGGLATVPLLYMPGVRIFPPQLNDGYSKRQGGDAEQLYRHGYWNAELEQKWLHEADFVLVEGWRYRSELRQEISPAEFNELEETPPLQTCIEGTQILIFRREP